MPQVAEIDVHVTGDIGGTGVSRFRFVRQDAALITGADANTAAAAAMAMLNSVKAQLPTFIVWSCQPQVNIYDSASGQVTGPLVVTALPANVVGTGGANGTAGVGCRVNWRTSTVVGRRLLRGAFFLVPCSTGIASTSGAIGASSQTAINAAAATYINTMTSAALYPVVWHRPAKGATSGGQTGIIVSGVCSSVPAGLRSRRH